MLAKNLGEFLCELYSNTLPDHPVIVETIVILFNLQVKVTLAVMFSPKMIKTSCGIDKYHRLKEDKSVWGKLRLKWFLVIAAVRDLNK